jgi:hypothetical protein
VGAFHRGVSEPLNYMVAAYRCKADGFPISGQPGKCPFLHSFARCLDASFYL